MTPAAAVTPLLGWSDGEQFDALLARCAAQPAWAPFDERAMAFVERFSRRLLAVRQTRQHPELAALAHWFRPATLRRLAADSAPRDGVVQRGRGLVFTIAPANVDSVFLYSCLLSLLAGNSNIVRLSQKASPAIDLVTAVLAEVLAEDVGRPVAGRLVLLTYAHDDAITAAISRHCHLRVVWGGNATVAAVRAIALRPTATELCFPDRFSAAALQALVVVGSSRGELEDLARRFVDDALQFGQQACSSPRWLAWVGRPDVVARAKAVFWPAVEQAVRMRADEDSGAMHMDRLNAAFTYAAGQHARPVPGAVAGAWPQRVAAEHGLDDALRDGHCGQGLFIEHQAGQLSELAAGFSDRDQTLAVHGFAPAEIQAFVDALGPRAIDRIVPVGQALAFSPVWDGQDLLTSFTRRIHIALSA
jgi:Acyl-CoA reductase (LuxC)